MIPDSENLLKKSGALCYLLVASVLLFGTLSRWAYDDPFITYRYADNLGHGNGFVYNPGERVLSTTTPLFTLLLAPFAAFGVDLHGVANWLGAFSMAISGLLLRDLSRLWHTPWVGRAGLLLYPTFGLVLSTTGSETPLYLALCIAAFAGYARRNYPLTALFCGLATLARPDGILVPAILFLHFACENRQNIQAFRRSNVFLAAFILLGILFAWGIFSWAYFGSPLPVTLAAKQNQGAMAISQKFAAGLLHVLKGYNRWPYWIEAAVASIGLLFAILQPRRWLLFAAWPVLYFTAYAFLGVSRYFWYYAPLVPGFVALVGLGFAMLEQLLSPLKGHRLDAWPALRRINDGWTNGIGRILHIQPFKASVSSVLLWAVLVALFAFQCWDVWKLGTSTDRHYAIYRAAGEWLKQNTPPGTSVGMLEVGIIGYYAQRPVVDFAGLIQPDVARQMQASSTYDDTALWAVARYQPAYVVLLAQSMPQLEQAYIVTHCQPVQNFPALQYNAPRDLIIYACQK